MKVNNDVQTVITGVTVTGGLISYVGLVGSYECNNISDIEFLVLFVLIFCIAYTIYNVLSNINFKITYRLYKTNKK